MTSTALLRHAARRAETNVDGLCYEAVMANDRAAVTARTILTEVATSTCCSEALRTVAVYFADERRQAIADRGLADA
jgi:hypothetical protein